MHCSNDRSFGGSDPLLDFLMLPQALLPISETMYIDQMVNQMMDSILIISPGNEQDHITRSEEVFDTMISSLAEHVSSESASADESDSHDAELSEQLPFDPVDFSEQLANHGKKLLATEQAEPRRRLARRLTEVTPNMFRQTYGHLPFGCYKNRCLLNAYQHRSVSSGCSAALLNKQQVLVQHRVALRNFKEEQEAFIYMVFVYGLMVMGTFVVVLYKFRKPRNPEKRRLKHRIFQAIYSNPKLKTAIEEELGQDLGNVPPVQLNLLRRVESGAQQNLFVSRSFMIVRIVAWTCMMLLATRMPFFAMFLLCITMGVQFCVVLCSPKQLDEDISCCCCCCCGLSTVDVSCHSKEQSSCDCCNGTGICAPSCACCNDDSEIESACVADDSDYQCCLDDGTIAPGTRRRMKQSSLHGQAFMAIPVQVV